MNQQISKVSPLGLRLPAELKEWVTEQAKKERRSVNSWLIVLIESAQRAEKENAPAAATVGASE